MESSTRSEGSVTGLRTADGSMEGFCYFFTHPNQLCKNCFVLICAICALVSASLWRGRHADTKNICFLQILICRLPLFPFPASVTSGERVAVDRSLLMVIRTNG